MKCAPSHTIPYRNWLLLCLEDCEKVCVYRIRKMLQSQSISHWFIFQDWANRNNFCVEKSIEWNWKREALLKTYGQSEKSYVHVQRFKSIEASIWFEMHIVVISSPSKLMDHGRWCCFLLIRSIKCMNVLRLCFFAFSVLSFYGWYFGFIADFNQIDVCALHMGFIDIHGNVRRSFFWTSSFFIYE